MTIDAEEADLRILQDGLSRTNDLTEKITASLTKLSTTASQVQDTITPIAGYTSTLTTVNNNIDLTLKAVANLKKDADLAVKEETTILKGCRTVGLDAYLKSLTRVLNGRKTIGLTKSATAPSITAKMDELLDYGTLSLENYFRETLQELSRPIPSSEFTNNDFIIPSFSDEISSTLSRLIHFFQTTLHSNRLITAYSTVRGAYLISSSGILAANSINSVAGETQYAKASEPFLIYSQALFGLLTTEYDNMSRLLPDEKLLRKCFLDTSETSLDEYAGVLQKIADTVSKNVIDRQLTAYDILESCIAFLSEYSERMRMSPPPSILKGQESLRHAVSGAFPETLRYIDRRTQSLSSIPSDFGVCDVTVDVASKLRKLADYQSTLAELHANDPVGSWIPSPKPEWAAILPLPASQAVEANQPMAPEKKVSAFMVDAIDDLILNLEIKAKTMIKRTDQVGLFCLSNLAMIENTIKSSALGQVFDRSDLERLNRLQKRGLNMFLSGWKSVAAILMDGTFVKTGQTSGGLGRQGMSSKDRELIKEKFRTFNSEFEDLLARHREYNIRDPDLRQILSKEIMFISPLYHRFYDRHINSEFTKHAEKYIHFDKTAFDQALQSLGK